VEEARLTTGGNIINSRAFSDRIIELMRKYTNQQLTSAEVIAELITMAREVAADGNRRPLHPSAGPRRTRLLRRGRPERVRDRAAR
jgi:hypothetical protein